MATVFPATLRWSRGKASVYIGGQEIGQPNEWTLKVEEEGMFHEIQIKKAMRGYVVQVGCKTLIYGEKEEEHNRLATDLYEYLQDPAKKTKEMEEEWEPNRGLSMNGEQEPEFPQRERDIVGRVTAAPPVPNP